MRFAQALRYLQAVAPRTPMPGWAEDLERLLAPDPPPSDFARWLAHAAHRWASIDREYALIAPRHDSTTDPIASVMLFPWVTDANLFDGGIFDTYLGRLAPVAVVDMCPQVRDWSAAPMRSLTCTSDVVDDGVRLLDSHSRETFLMVAPTGEPVAPGLRFLGRPLPVPGGRHITAIRMVTLGRWHPEPPDLSSPDAWLGWLGRLMADRTIAA